VAWAALAGCASHPPPDTLTRPFAFGADNFSYTNDLLWEYAQDPVTGKTSHRKREPKPTYTHHCFVVAKAAAQFHRHAQFEPHAPQVSPEIYGEKVREIVSRTLAGDGFCQPAVIIPGYSNLFHFSREQEALLQANCGGAWKSYFQRGHWRMVLPFSASHQERMTGQLMKRLIRNQPAVLHVVRFPQLSINHAILAYDYTEDDNYIQFRVYDPYSPQASQTLTYCRDCRTFYYPANAYFVGGRVDVYQIYHRWNY
jgi:hypothetical protein